ncbi:MULTISPECIES: YggS family pyridoxal phosphate-dependent enzyme [unclassified Enterococcus]|uniref:YggS family pyridoxal phosphate-dependent enzyme n=1 Tax=unclassified Enterococcus TaxID=2608891 RepID=UPI001555F8DD|nr:MULTISPECIES: YggS family pyridoxal phosphate-dependent enzyme [unclassified Enterococcus]MBS7577651.1 YggS family pyridoxal phosphate-dependent enzyme [Enterococcus sp. MMGLQ5-2]MBS7584155.1 YggS family pyridoxal phosphate-dependent enzyme [Enterococcus sp. MMGLQ5-1]NPD12013.1 YggS family pyridoxal phosphate-dependent enzyme [Enterococcus sp. MMGLQ5-1]NPD37484.1 YggS family pyridoxal phosphate-dependent enzyme [Enterococcus sp. MMGLQ5-2]
MLKDKFESIVAQINQAKAKANRHDKVHLIGVTKYVDISQARALVQAGVDEIAENRTELFLEKYHAMQDLEVTWHLIGSLQRRKVKDVINLVDYFHALDSFKLAQEIQKRAQKTISVFVQVNVSGEASKHGVSPEDLLPFIKALAALSHITVVGLMTMAPMDADDSDLRKYFSALRQYRDEIEALNLSYAPCHELSMGMSRDYPIAIEAGATYVRIGSDFFKNN